MARACLIRGEETSTFQVEAICTMSFGVFFARPLVDSLYQAMW
jgi:hypothetical protein